MRMIGVVTIGVCFMSGMALAAPGGESEEGPAIQEPQGKIREENPLFSRGLYLAKCQIENVPVVTINAVPVEAGGAATARIGRPGVLGDDPLPTTEGPTCDVQPTCTGFSTCNGYPTCHGQNATNCQTTCPDYPTCHGDTTCTNTCSGSAGYPTCSGSGATNCQSTCNNYPTCTGSSTCTQTCKGAQSYPTCSGTAVTACGQATCNQYPTCSGTPGCTPTAASYPTCNGTVVTTCTSTCNTGKNGYPTCDTTCTQFPTCNGVATCTSTCHGAAGTTAWPTCDTSVATCTAPPPECQSTGASWPTCWAGAPPTRCADTCSGHPGCIQGMLGRLLAGGLPHFPFTGIALGGLFLGASFRRRRVELLSSELLSA